MLLALIVKNFAARAARTGIAHRPKVIVIAEAVDALLRYVLRLEPKRLVVFLVHGDVEFFFRKL